MILVAYGVRERSVGEAGLVEALRAVAIQGESPERMHAVLGPPGRGVRWFTFASTFDQVLHEDQLADAIQELVPELFVAVRERPDEPPTRFEICGRDVRRFIAVREGNEIAMTRGALPDPMPRDPEI